MVSIEIRQNNKFVPGYPYNSSVDEYFKGLSDEFISNYGLSDEDAININNHKNQTLKFDRDLHTFIIKLSSFIKGFENEGQLIIDDYEKLKVSYKNLKGQVEIYTTTVETSQNDFDYSSNNIAVMNSDLEKINALILFYESQLIDETFEYSDGYIDETTERLQIIDDVILQNTTDEAYYADSVSNKVSNYINELATVASYGGYEEISLRNHYEAWKNRQEEYYQALTSYFKDEYESSWTYGQSLAYGEKITHVDAKKKEIENVYSLWKQTLFKTYEFKYEKQLKEYSMAWLQERETFDKLDFTRAVEEERKKILNIDIPLIENLVQDKTSALRSVISLTKEQNYYKYIELIQLKREHIYKNILNNTIDQDLLDAYTSKMLTFKADYEFVKTKMSQSTYWNYYYDLERYQSLLTDIRRKYDIVVLAISRDFQKESGSNEHTNEKIDFYKEEKIDIKRKISELTVLKDKIEIELNANNDELTLLKSKLFEVEKLISDKINEYLVYFDSRITFFTQNIEITEKDGISDLIDGNFYKEFNEKFDIIKNYNSNILWWNVDNKHKLFTHYETILDKLNMSMMNEWEIEFNHEIMSIKKVEYYSYYIDNKLRELYVKIHKFILDKTYDLVFYENVSVELENIFKNFSKLVDYAFDANKNIEINTDIFDYSDNLIFRISENIETRENIISTFSEFTMVVKSYVFEKNKSFRLVDIEIENMDKVNKIWNDMEKKYV